MQKMPQNNEARPSRDPREQALENIRGYCDEGRQMLESMIALFAIIDGAAIADGGHDYEVEDEARRDFNYSASTLAGDLRAIKSALAVFEAEVDDEDESSPLSAAAEE